jgi:hypothetical protein
LTAGTTLACLRSPGEVIDHEVADPDGADLPVAQQRLQGAVGLQRPSEVRRQGLVQDEQVDLVDTELAGALVEAAQGLVVAVVADPDLGFEEHLGPVHARAADRLADLPFVAVRGRGVDVPVAGGERRFDSGPRLLRRRLEDTEPDSWHLDAVVQRELRGGHGRSPSLLGRRADGRPRVPLRTECVFSRPGGIADARTLAAVSVVSVSRVPVRRTARR